MSYVPPFTALQAWMAQHRGGDCACLSATYDDLLDVLKRFLQPVPVDAEWYQQTYPPVGVFLQSMRTETASSHFQKHGYFEGRSPFAPGWRGLTAPAPFADAYRHLLVTPARGRLHIQISPADFIGLIGNILIAVPVDAAWYTAAYPAAAEAIALGQYDSAISHYAQRGYFDGHMPFAIPVDEDWYAARYDHVRSSLDSGAAASPRDHFFRVGYLAGCRPSPP